MSGRLLLLVGHSTGGIGGHVASLAAHLPDRGWDTTVVTSAATAERFDLAPADVHVLWPRVARDLPRRLRALRRRLAGCDVVHAHGHQAGVLAVALAVTLRPRPRVVVSWHNAVLARGAGRRVRGLLERVQARRADLVTGASQDLVDHARRLGASGAELSPVAAPVPPDVVEVQRDAGRPAVAEALGVDATGPWVVTVARIAPQKNLHVVVDAAARLTDRAGLEWLVVGDGDPGLLEELRSRAGRVGAPVRFVGARRDAVRLMALADVFVLASEWEARALVVQEAMAVGTPVVATAVGGLPELVGAAGVLVPPRDPEALARAVAGVLDDHDRAAGLAAAGRRRYAGLPSEDDVVSEWCGRYDRLLASTRPSG